MKIVINNCYGGFCVSKDFCDYYKINYRQDFSWYVTPLEEIKRTDKRLIDYIEKFGSNKASGLCSDLVVEEIEKGHFFRIDEYDGYESIVYNDQDDWIIAD